MPHNIICPSSLLFWGDVGTNARIERAHQDGSDRQTIVSSHIGSPNGLTLDTKGQVKQSFHSIRQHVLQNLIYEKWNFSRPYWIFFIKLSTAKLLAYDKVFYMLYLRTLMLAKIQIQSGLVRTRSIFCIPHGHQINPLCVPFIVLFCQFELWCSFSCYCCAMYELVSFRFENRLPVPEHRN